MVNPQAPDGPRAATNEANVALAWRILSSPRTLLVLSALLALVFVLAAALPQRPSAGELARRMPFASAEAASGLGLVDALVAWPTLLLILLLALNATGILLARQQAREARPPAAADPRGKKRGLAREGAVLAFFGVVALLTGLVLSRSSALDARITLWPGATARAAETSVREGDLFLPRALPYDLACARPDPQDPRRHFECRLASAGPVEPVPLTLVPGAVTSAGDLELRPLVEWPRAFAPDEPFALLLSRPSAEPGGAPALERLVLEPGKTVELRATGQRLTALSGPDGPLLTVEREGQPTVLMAPPFRVPAPDAPAAAGGLGVEAITPTELRVAAVTAPEAPLVLAGVLLFIVGLALAGWTEARA